MAGFEKISGPNDIPSQGDISAIIARISGPTTQLLTSGSGATYTTPANVKWLEVYIVGGGGGGAGASTVAATFVAGSDGTASTFNSINANPGKGAPSTLNVAALGGSSGTGSATRRVNGEYGFPSTSNNLFTNPSGDGGNSWFAFGGAPAQPSNTIGANGTTNTGGGGSGGSNNGGVNANNGGGGSGAETAYLIINTPAATYIYTIGPGGAGGISTTNGGAGGSGVIFVIEHYV